MTQHTIQLLIIGSIFSIIGIATLVFKKQKKKTGFIPLTIGLLAITLTIAGPLSQSYKQLDAILTIDKNDISEIQIKPATYKGNETLSLLKTTISITDQATIDSLCTAINSGTIRNAVIKNPAWVCLVRLEKKHDSSIEFAVKNAGQNTIIEVNSDVEHGWNYGTIDVPLLGQLLTRISK
ncbi:hypothetical protein [Ferruginibacter sp. SUN106]|uniref:hypothetical protein n=1 Tax=Ferruginibacter sp. SUN106 TaxID=2978348 RepID=UPI003D35F000